MNSINVQLPETINNSALPKVDEVHLTLYQLKLAS